MAEVSQPRPAAVSDPYRLATGQLADQVNLQRMVERLTCRLHETIADGPITRTHLQ